jgi:hypothetical protein
MLFILPSERGDSTHKRILRQKTGGCAGRAVDFTHPRIANTGIAVDAFTYLQMGRLWVLMQGLLNRLLVCISVMNAFNALYAPHSERGGSAHKHKLRQKSGVCAGWAVRLFHTPPRC